MVKYAYILLIIYFVSISALADENPTDKLTALKELQHLASKLPYSKEDYLAYSRMQIPLIIPLLEEEDLLSKIVQVLLQKALPLLTTEEDKKNCKSKISLAEELNSTNLRFIPIIKDTMEQLNSFGCLTVTKGALEDLKTQQKAHDRLYWFDESQRSLKNLIYYAKEQSNPNVSIPGKHLAAYFLTANINNALNELESSIYNLRGRQINLENYISMPPEIQKNTRVQLKFNKNSELAFLSYNALYPKWNDWVINIQNKVERFEKVLSGDRIPQFAASCTIYHSSFSFF